MNFKVLSLSLLAMTFISLTLPVAGPSRKHAQKILDEFCVLMPSGTAWVHGDSVSVQSFYMSTTEITNLQYREFLHDLRIKGEWEKLKIAQMDTASWTRSLPHAESMARHYHIHPAYNHYPVVGVSGEGATLFCEWLTEVYDSISHGELKLKFRLPTQAEWLRAARGDRHNQQYAWEQPTLRNKTGQVLANFLRIGAENVTRDPETEELKIVLNDHVPDANSNLDILAPAKSYWPNEYGFYNLNGNAAELLADGQNAIGGSWASPGYDIRNESIRKVNGAEPTVGFRVVATVVSP